MENPYQILFDEISLIKQQYVRIEALLLSQQQPPSTEPDRFLDVNEAANFLKLTTGTLYQYVHSGKLPVFKKGGKLRFSLKALREWVNSGRIEMPEEILEESRIARTMNNHINTKQRSL